MERNVWIEEAPRAQKEEEKDEDEDRALRWRNRALVFDANVAQGSPLTWNDRASYEYMNNKARKIFPDPGSDKPPDLSVFLDFLRLRKGADGVPMLSKLGTPQMQTGGDWFRLQWQPHATASSADSCQRLYQPTPGMEKAWHGCKLEALYSIMYHGCILESSDKSKGHRFFADKKARGVYCFGGTKSYKATTYCRWMCLEGTTFFQIKWELLVDRSWGAFVEASWTDQWIQKPSGVRLVALWVRAREGFRIDSSDEFTRQWRPEAEANPLQFVEQVRQQQSFRVVER